MLTANSGWSTEGVGVFSALLIALAGGWAASRLVRAHPDPFACMVLGVTGAVAGMTLAGVLHFGLGPVGLLAASIAGGAGLFALCAAVSNVTKRRRNRNLVGPREFESCAQTGRPQEDP